MQLPILLCRNKGINNHFSKKLQSVFHEDPAELGIMHLSHNIAERSHSVLNKISCRYYVCILSKFLYSMYKQNNNPNNSKLIAGKKCVFSLGFNVLINKAR